MNNNILRQQNGVVPLVQQQEQLAEEERKKKKKERENKLDDLGFLAKLLTTANGGKDDGKKTKEISKMIESQKGNAVNPGEEKIKKLFETPPKGYVYLDNARNVMKNKDKTLFQNLQDPERIDKENLKNKMSLDVEVDPVEYHLYQDKKYKKELRRKMLIADDVYNSKVALESDFKPGYIGGHTPLDFLMRSVKKHDRYNSLLRNKKGFSGDSTAKAVEEITGEKDVISAIENTNKLKLLNKLGVKDSNYIDSSLINLISGRNYYDISDFLKREKVNNEIRDRENFYNLKRNLNDFGNVSAYRNIPMDDDVLCHPELRVM